MPNPFDVSQLTGRSNAGATNKWVDWHTQVNNQVPFYLQSRQQPVPASMSANSGTNVVFAGSPNKTNTDLTPKETPTPPAEGNWWDDVTKWAVKEFVIPFMGNFIKNPVKATVGLINPSTALPTLVGKGDPLAGTFAILDVPGKVVTSTLINAGRTVQLLRQGIDGTANTDNYWNDMGKAWNWDLHDDKYVPVTKSDQNGNIVYEYEKNDDGTDKILKDDSGNVIYQEYEDGSPVLDVFGQPVPAKEIKYENLDNNIDIGTAFMYLLGQTTGIVPQIVVAPVPEAKAQFEKTMIEWGFVPSTTNFDIFDPAQVDQITGVQRDRDGLTIDGTGNGWTLGNVLTQTFNFAGDLGLDPLSYVPFGKVGRIAFSGRNLMTNGAKNQIVKRVVEDATTLAAAAEGKSTVYDNFLRYAANNSAERIANHVVIRSITTGEKDKVAYLLGQVTKPEDAAKVLLALEYGSIRAQQELLRDYGKISLAVDSLHGGGYLTRAIANGKLLPEEDILNHALHADFYKELMKYSDDIVKSPFSNTLRNAAYEISDEGISLATKAMREITPVNIKWAFGNKLLSGLEEGGANLGAFFINGVTDAGHIALERPFRYGTNFVLHQIIRVGSKDAKGVIDVSNIDGIASGKFYGALNDIDRVTKGRLSMRPKDANGNFTGLSAKQILTEQWMRSASALERAKIVEDANRVGLELIAGKHGADEMALKAVAAELTQRRLIFGNNLDKTGLHVFNQDGKQVIYHDPYSVGRGNTEVSLWNWNKVDTAFLKSKSVFAQGVIGTAEGASRFINEMNGLFNALVVTRGSRFVRDIIANSVTTIGSGYASQMFQYLHPVQAVKSAAAKTTNIGDFAKRLTIRKGNIRDTGAAMTTLESEKSAIEDVLRGQYQYVVDQLAMAPLENLTQKDIVSWIVANDIINRKVGYHYTAQPIIPDLDENRLFVSYESPLDAGKRATERLSKPIQTKMQSRQEALAMPDSAGTRPTTVDELVTAQNNGDIIHVRTKGRKQPWSTFEVPIRLGLRYDLKKYEYRIFSKDAFDAITLDDLKKLADDPAKGYKFKSDNEDALWQTLTPDNAAKLKSVPDFLVELPYKSEPVIYTPHIYGLQVDFGRSTAGLQDEYTRTLSDLAKAYANDPTLEVQEALLKEMRRANIGNIRVADDSGDMVNISDPQLTVLHGDNGDATQIMNRTLDAIGFGAVDRGGISANAGEIASWTSMTKGEVIPGTPMYVPQNRVFEANVKPMPKGWTILSVRNPADPDAPKFVLQIGGVRFDEYAVRFSFTEKGGLVFNVIKPKSKISLDETVKAARKGKDATFLETQNYPKQYQDWYRVQATPKLTLGDFLSTGKLKDITRESTENIARISEQERRLIEAQANFGTFDGQTLAHITKQRSRLDDIDRQLFYLYQNLSYVSGKLSKKEVAERAAIEAKLKYMLKIPADKPLPKYDDPLLESFRMPDPTKGAAFDQSFGDALLGKNGSTWYAKVKDDSAEVRAQGTGFFTATDSVINRVVKPGDKDYWTAWQRTLNEHWRGPDGSDLDPVIRKILEGQVAGQTDEAITNTILTWLKKTPEGLKYSQEVGLGAKFANFDHGVYVRPKTRFEQMTEEDYLEMQMANVLQHVGYVGKGFEDDAGDFFAGNVVADKLLKNQSITVEDLIKSRLREPRSFQTTTGGRINRETGQLEMVGEQTFKNLPDIWGTLNDPVARRGLIEKGKFYLSQVNRVIADIPQEILFQKPLFRSAYAKSLERQTTQMRLATGRDFFTDAELNSMQEKARSFALAETRKWVYSSASERNIMNGIRKVVPFANASVFTAKWMANVAKERPVYLAWMVYEYNKAINGTQWYDRNGNVVDYNAKGEDGKPLAQYMKGNYPPGIINLLAGKSWDDPWAKNYVSDTFISRTSLDPIFNGNNFDLFGVNVPNPFINWGLTPGPAMLFSELTKEAYKNPDSLLGKLGKVVNDFNAEASKTGIIPNLLPFGVSPTELSWGYLIPGQVAKLQIDEQQVLKLRLDAATLIWGRYIADPENNPKPTEELIEEVAGGMFDLKFRTSFFMPFATKYLTQVDIARNTWQTYLKDEQDALKTLEKKYRDQGLDDATAKQKAQQEYTALNIPGYGRSYQERQANIPGAKPYNLDPYAVAQSKFLNEHYDLFYGAVSQSSGDLKLTSTEKTGANLAKYGAIIPGLVSTSEGADVASDILNGTSSSSTGVQSYVFDQNVYNILIEQQLVSKSTPAEMARKVQVAKGNELFRKGIDKNKDGKIREQDGDILGMNALDNLAFERNTPIDVDKDLAAKKARLINEISTQGGGWTVQGFKPGWGQVWADERTNISPERYNNYATAWDKAFTGTSWSNDVKKENFKFWDAATTYLKERGDVQEILQDRGSDDPAKARLSANPDLQTRLRERTLFLKNYDTTGKFSEWYNNYFEGDTIN